MTLNIRRHRQLLGSRKPPCKRILEANRVLIQLSFHANNKTNEVMTRYDYTQINLTKENECNTEDVEGRIKKK